MKRLPGPRRLLTIASVAAVLFLLIAQVGAYLQFVLVPARTLSMSVGPQNTADLVFGVMAIIGTVLGALLTLATGVLGIVVVVMDRRYLWLLAVFGSGLIALAGLLVWVGFEVGEIPPNPYDPLDAFVIVPITALAYSALGGWVWQPSAPGRRGRLSVVVAATSLTAVLLAACAIWGVTWANDNGGTSVPAASGSGQCTSADSVNVNLIYADGHVTQLCTHDRPACLNRTISGSMNGQQLADVSQFQLNSQLRGSSARYSVTIIFDGPLASETSEESLPIDQAAGQPAFPGTVPVAATSATSAFISVGSIARRNTSDPSFTSSTGSITVSSSHGVARGRIDATVAQGGGRPDRPAPPQTATPPARITGTYACNR